MAGRRAGTARRYLCEVDAPRRGPNNRSMTIRTRLALAAVTLLVASLGVTHVSADEAGKTYGDGVTLKRAMPIATLLEPSRRRMRARPCGWMAWSARSVSRWGAGSRSPIPALGRGIRFKAKDGVIVFPKDASGRKVSAQGTFEEIATSAVRESHARARQGRPRTAASRCRQSPDREDLLGARHRRGSVLMADADRVGACRPTCSMPSSAKAEAIGVPAARRHIFLCCDQAKPKCCERERSIVAWDYLKARLLALGLADQGGIARTKANCLRICTGGPVAVVYPEGRLVRRLRSTRARTDHPGAPDRWASGRGVRDRGSAARRERFDGERRPEGRRLRGDRQSSSVDGVNAPCTARAGRTCRFRRRRSRRWA